MKIYYICGGMYPSKSDPNQTEFDFVHSSRSSIPFIFESPREALSCAHHSALYKIKIEDERIISVRKVDDKRFAMTELAPASIKKTFIDNQDLSGVIKMYEDKRVDNAALGMDTKKETNTVDIYVMKLDGNGCYSVDKLKATRKVIRNGAYENEVLINPDVHFTEYESFCYSKEKMENNMEMYTFMKRHEICVKSYSLDEPDENMKAVFIKTAKEDINELIDYIDKDLQYLQERCNERSTQKENWISFINSVEKEENDLENCEPERD